jgi:hypothetical protein
VFHLEYPFRFYNLPLFRTWDELPSLHSKKRGKFFICRLKPTMFVRGFKKLAPSFRGVYIRIGGSVLGPLAIAVRGAPITI